MFKGLLGGLQNKLNSNIAKFAKDPNFLQALCSVAVYVGSSDGNFSQAEEDQAVAAILNNELIKQANFDPRVVQSTMDTMADKLKAGVRSGRAALLKEIRDIAGNADMAEAVVLLGLDLADNDGIEAGEANALRNVGKELGLEKFVEAQLAA